MAVDHCPVHAGFDPLSADFLADPYTIMAALPLAETPVFYAPAIDGYVVTRHADIDAVFHDPDTYSAAAAQMPLVAVDPQGGRDRPRRVLGGGGADAAGAVGPEGGRYPPRRRPQTAAVDGQLRPARPHPSAPP